MYNLPIVCALYYNISGFRIFLGVFRYPESLLKRTFFITQQIGYFIDIHDFPHAISTRRYRFTLFGY